MCFRLLGFSFFPSFSPEKPGLPHSSAVPTSSAKIQSKSGLAVSNSRVPALPTSSSSSRLSPTAAGVIPSPRLPPTSGPPHPPPSSRGPLDKLKSMFGFGPTVNPDQSRPHRPLDSVNKVRPNHVGGGGGGKDEDIGARKQAEAENRIDNGVYKEIDNF